MNRYIKNFFFRQFQAKNILFLKNVVNLQQHTSIIMSFNYQQYKEILSFIEKNCRNDYSGIIITHGTDTLSFTASALSQYFYNFNKPVVLVSSDKPIKENKTTIGYRK